MIRAACLLALMVCMGAPLSLAEDGIELTRGSLVRVTAPGTWGGRLEGRLESVGAETLVVELSYGGRGQVARDGGRRLRVSRGPRPPTRQGMAWGALAGAVVGAFPTAEDRARGRCSSGLECSAVTGVGGALMGALIGTFIRSPRWEAVPLTRIQPTVALDRSTFSAAVRLSF